MNWILLVYLDKTVMVFLTAEVNRLQTDKKNLISYNYISQFRPVRKTTEKSNSTNSNIAIEMFICINTCSTTILDIR